MRIKIDAIRFPSLNNKNSSQLMASALTEILDIPCTMLIQLMPKWGSAADYYMVRMTTIESGLDNGWVPFKVSFQLNALEIGNWQTPGFLYIAEPTDIPTEILRFREIEGPLEGWKQDRYDAGYWALTFQRLD